MRRRRVGRRVGLWVERGVSFSRVARAKWRYGLVAGLVAVGIGVGVGVGASAYTRNEAVQGRVAQVRASESAAVQAAPSGQRGRLARRYAKRDAVRPKSLRDKRRALRRLRKKGLLNPSPSPTVTHRVHGILDSNQYAPGMLPRYFYVANQWIGKVNGREYLVCAGGGSIKGTPNGPETAAVGVFVSRAGVPHRIGLYWSRHGEKQWRVVSAHGHVLTLRGKDGDSVKFDVAKRRFH